MSARIWPDWIPAEVEADFGKVMKEHCEQIEQNVIASIDIPASLALAHKKHDQGRTLPSQLQFCLFERQKKEVQKKMLHEIFKVRGYPLVLDCGSEYRLHLK